MYSYPAQQLKKKKKWSPSLTPPRSFQERTVEASEKNPYLRLGRLRVRLKGD
jgi:hypothetical protein